MRKSILSNRGITMIEIIIGVVIVGIAAAMAVPRFQTAVERMQFRSANRDIVSALRMARSQAISQHSAFGIYFDYGALTMTLFEKKGTDMDSYEPAWDDVVRVDTLGGTDGKFLDYIITSLDDSPTESSIVFESDGSATAGGDIFTIELTDAMVGVAHINVLPSTGRVTLENTWIY